MARKNRTELFETTPIPKAVATLAIPTVIGSLVTVLYNLADTYFVGFINNPIENAAVTLAAPVLLAFNAVTNLFGVGSASYMSRSLGRHDHETAKRTAAFGFYLALFSALFFSLLSFVLRRPLLSLLGARIDTFASTSAYLLWTVTCGATPAILNVVIAHMVRSEGMALHASIGSMSGCLLNILLDPFFIMPQWLDMGAAGAGLATLISNLFSCGYFFVLLTVRRDRTCVTFAPRLFSFRPDIAKGVFAVGIPASIQNLLNVTGMTVLNNFASSFGTDAVAAMGITHKINMVPMQISMGLGQGIMPLIGYNYASGNGRRMKDTFFFALRISISFILFASVSYFLFAGDLVSLFMEEPSIVAHGTRLLRGFCLGLPFLAVDFLAVGVFQAVGMGREALLFAILRKVALEIPALYILNALYPLYGLAYSQPVAELVLSAAALVVIRRLFRKVSE